LSLESSHCIQSSRVVVMGCAMAINYFSHPPNPIIAMEPIDIFIVDDNLLVRQGVAQTLRRAGYSVEEFTDPNDALQAMTDRKKANLLPGLIVTDYSMPQMTGANMMKIIRKLYGLKTLPIIMLSAETKQERKDDAAAAGITAWVQKSKVLQELIPLVREHLPR
jgi:two-component system, chemotaxis family, chemotaxis protein CheY